MVSLKRKKIGNRLVKFDLYLAVSDVNQFCIEHLDDFVCMRENLDALAATLKPHMNVLRFDWVSDWLDPTNAAQAGTFHKLFPQAKATGAVHEAAFESALWLSRVCLQPFGEGGAAPIATWDFHILPKDKDDTVFVVRTAPDGKLINVTVESCRS